MSRGATRFLLALSLAAGACGRTTESERQPQGARPTSSAPAASSTSRPPSGATSARGEKGFAPPVLLGEVFDPTLDESSGLIASRRNPGLLWTHNDSGDEARLYCLTSEAARCGTWSVKGAEAFDWEDIAAGPGPVAGTPYLFVGDIGDNRRARSDVVVYRVAEPMAPRAGEGVVATAPAVALRLQYEDGPHDAEALLVHPVSGDLYVITKGPHATGVDRAAQGSTVLARIADLDLGAAETVTGADISPDGRRVVVCTYRQAYELTLPTGGGKPEEIWGQRKSPIALAWRIQGEAIAYRLDGGAVLTTSEGSPFPLHEAVRR